MLGVTEMGKAKPAHEYPEEEEQAPPKKRIHRRASTPSVEAEPAPKKQAHKHPPTPIVEEDEPGHGLDEEPRPTNPPPSK